MKCFVPSCENYNDPAAEDPKVFFSVPRNALRRDWFEAVNRKFSEKTPLSSNMICCEDHFNLTEDVEGWTIYKLLKKTGCDNTPRLKIKRGVVPHISKVNQSQRSDQNPLEEVDPDLQARLNCLTSTPQPKVLESTSTPGPKIIENKDDKPKLKKKLTRNFSCQVNMKPQYRSVVTQTSSVKTHSVGCDPMSSVEICQLFEGEPEFKSKKRKRSRLQCTDDILWEPTSQEFSEASTSTNIMDSSSKTLISQKDKNLLRDFNWLWPVTYSNSSTETEAQ